MKTSVVKCIVGAIAFFSGFAAIVVLMTLKPSSTERLAPMTGQEIATDELACQLVQMNTKFTFNSEGQIVLVQCLKKTI